MLFFMFCFLGRFFLPFRRTLRNSSYCWWYYKQICTASC